MSKEILTCPICGAPTSTWYGNARKDGLCRLHAQQLKEGLIEQCPDCGKWHEAGKPCECKSTVTKHSEGIKTSELTCIICGEPSNGKHFCRSCYAKYKDRTIDIRIKNCNEVTMLDIYGNKIYTCDDGRKVRSKSEKIISDFLFKEAIRTVYEKTVYYYPDKNGNEQPIELHPDFYLPDYNIYIEHNGLNTKSYKANKVKTEQMYKELGYQLIITTEEDLEDISAKLKPLLKLN